MAAAAAAALPFTLTKFSENPVIGPSGIKGSQDACGARDMGLELGSMILGRIGVPPPGKNELVLPIVQNTVPFPRELNTPF